MRSSSGDEGFDTLQEMFDVVVIGAGMVGSACAKYAAQLGRKTCLVGPGEVPLEEYGRHEIFGSYFDEGRIIWTMMRQEPFISAVASSMSSYMDIERKTGIKILHPQKCLLVTDTNPQKDGFFKWCDRFEGPELSQKFQFMNEIDGVIGLLDNDHVTAGLNPRKLVEAQRKLFLEEGGTWLERVAVKVERVVSSSARFRVRLDDSSELLAKSVVLCAGAFLRNNDLLMGHTVAVDVKPAMAARFEVDPINFKDMPNTVVEDCSALPMGLYSVAPLLYPDGKYYLKVGLEDPVRDVLTPTAVTKWFLEGYDCVQKQLIVDYALELFRGKYYLKVGILKKKDVLDPAGVTNWFQSADLASYGLLKLQVVDYSTRLFKGLDPGRVIFDRCSLTYTADANPIMRALEPGFLLFTGCNGDGAACSDEFGRRMAVLACEQESITTVPSVEFEFVVIGAGMVGSATAKYLAKSGSSVCLIGPSEPRRSDYDKTDIFGGHYDEARITRRIATDPFWADVAKKSIARYPDIERASGIDFHEKCDCLIVGDIGSPLIRDVTTTASELGIEVQQLNNRRLREKFPYFRLSKYAVGVYEKGTGAGAINPRGLVDAQKRIFVKSSGVLIDDIVVSCEKTSYGYSIKTRDGSCYRARKVVLCAGAFLKHNNVLPSGIHINVRVEPTLAMRVSIGDAHRRLLSDMPTLMMRQEHGIDGLQKLNEILKSARLTIIPPTKYPDGKYYMKFICTDPKKKEAFRSPQDVSDWYRAKPDHKLASDLKETCALVKGLCPENCVYDACALTYTPTDRPYMDEIQDGFFIFTGCNGYAAKSSDELGRLLARLARNGVWDSTVVRKADLAIRASSRL